MAGECLRATGGVLAGRLLPLRDAFVIGRAEAGDGALGGDDQLSRRHARIARTAAGELSVEDLGSTNGTFVNGYRVTQAVLLRPGDRLLVGQTPLELVAAPEAPVAHPVVTAPPPPAAPPAQAAPVAPRPVERLSLARTLTALALVLAAAASVVAAVLS